MCLSKGHSNYRIYCLECRDEGYSCLYPRASHRWPKPWHHRRPRQCCLTAWAEPSACQIPSENMYTVGIQASSSPCTALTSMGFHGFLRADVYVHLETQNIWVRGVLKSVLQFKHQSYFLKCLRVILSRWNAPEMSILNLLERSPSISIQYLWGDFLLTVDKTQKILNKENSNSKLHWQDGWTGVSLSALDVTGHKVMLGLHQGLKYKPFDNCFYNFCKICVYLDACHLNRKEVAILQALSETSE